MNVDPVAEIRRLEHSVASSIAEAKAEAETAIAEAERRAEEMVAEAQQRGLATAEERYRDALTRARDDAQRIVTDGEEGVAALRRRAEAQVPGAVDLVMTIVLPSRRGD